MGKQITGSGASDVGKLKKTIDAKCIVEFRPFENANSNNHYNDDFVWKGQYGFDWYRIGDCKESGQHTHYVGSDHLVGVYTDQNNNRYVNGCTTDPDNKSYDNNRYFKYNFRENGTTKNDFFADELAQYHTYREIRGLKTVKRNYIIPWISLSEHSFIKINMIIKNDSTNVEHLSKIVIFSPGDKVSFGIDNKLKKLTNGIVAFNYIVFKGPFAKEQTITVPLSYNKQIKTDHDHIIKAYAYFKEGGEEYRTLAGQFNIVNYNPKKVDIWFIPVVTQTDDVCYNPSTQNDQQSDSPCIDFNKQKENLRKYLAQALVVPNFMDEGRNVVISQDLSSFSVRGGVSRSGYRLIQTLLKKFNDKYGENNAYKIFFINQKGFNDHGDEIRGHSYGIGSHQRSAVIFSSLIESTVCHELLHCFGLYHSFSNNNYKKDNKGRSLGFTFKQYETSNIMDYQSSISRVSLWRWQWEIIRTGKQDL